MRHPKQLYVLFFVEMFERFGYYLMLAILDLFLMKKFGMDEGKAGTTTGDYMALVYLAPIFGGMIADRIGFRISILMGTVLLALGYFTFGMGTMMWVWVSMGILAFGNGLFKPNISSLVGKLYPEGDPRRDSAFSIFYMGINIGSLPSAIVGGYVAEHYGWYQAFCVAGVGMLLSNLIFLAHYKLFAEADKRLPKAEIKKEPLTALEKERIRALVIMCFIVTVFWACFHQNATSLVVWAKDHTDLTLGGLLAEPLNPVYFGSVNPFFVIVLTPLVVWGFSWLRKRGMEPSNPGKIAVGMLLTAASFGMMVLASLAGGNHGRVSASWLVGSYFVVTVAELCLSPMGLSMVTKLAPAKMLGLLMGTWMLATSVGNKLSGLINIWWNEWSHATFFGVLASSSVVAALAILVQLRRLTAAMPKEIPNTAADEMLPPNLKRTLTVGLVQPEA